ncbi:MAG: hypothetical protein U1F83_20120 [Verrucomicrobiota bacterium]
MHALKCSLPELAQLVIKHAPILLLTGGLSGGMSFGQTATGFSDDNWMSMGGITGTNNRVLATAVDGLGSVYIGTGNYVGGGRAQTNYILKWNGNSWSALGSGMKDTYSGNAWVGALAVTGNDLYAGGYFNRAGNALAKSVAKWNGTNWVGLEFGLVSAGGDAGLVYALAISGRKLYAGGNFTAAGYTQATNIAEWNGSNWSALGSGLNGYVNALAVMGGDLYAGGDFTSAGGNLANYIARWDGTNWLSLGFGLDNQVCALAASGSNLYAGGLFDWATNKDGTTVAVGGVAKWDGTNWSALGTGLNLDVYSLAVSASNLYSGGFFTKVGGTAANCIAKWDGLSWSALGSGVEINFIPGTLAETWPAVNALAVSGNDLFVGGIFMKVGGKMSPHLARAYLPTLPRLSLRQSGADVILSWPSADTDVFVLEQVGALPGPASWVTSAALVTGDSTNKVAILPVANDAQYFRLRRQ